MAVLKVARMGHPVLRQIASPVAPGHIRSAEFQRFCDDLLETMYDEDGAGLAAPQVHHSERVVVFELKGEPEPMWLINPEITPVGDERVGGYEGCLSLPDMRGRVERFRAVSVRALGRDGAPFSFQAFGWAARIVQHECDHLDGVLYIDRADPKSMAFLPEYRRYGPLVPVPGDEDEDDEDDAGDEE